MKPPKQPPVFPQSAQINGLLLSGLFYSILFFLFLFFFFLGRGGRGGWVWFSVCGSRGEGYTDEGIAFLPRSPEQVTARLDALIHDLRTRFQAHAIGKPKGSVTEPYDVLIVAHGHILRALAGRWINKDIADNPSLILEAGGVGTLSYEHHSLDEPAILLGGAFMSDIVEQAEKDEREELEKARE